MLFTKKVLPEEIHMGEGKVQSPSLSLIPQRNSGVYIKPQNLSQVQSRELEFHNSIPVSHWQRAIVEGHKFPVTFLLPVLVGKASLAAQGHSYKES